MCRLLLTFGLICLISPAALQAADPPPDSPGARSTREKLKEKVNVDDYDNVMLREIISELKTSVKGRVRIKTDPSAGITLTSRFSIKAKGKTLEEVLDLLCKQKDWGYYVVVSTKKDDQDDGAIILTNKPLRGYPEGMGPKDKKDKK